MPHAPKQRVGVRWSPDIVGVPERWSGYGDGSELHTAWLFSCGGRSDLTPD